MARALGIVLVGFAGLASAACGGATDVPRLEDDRVLATAPLSCDVAETYTNKVAITAFDQSGFSIACGTPGEVVCSFYQNNDMRHSPNGTIDDDPADPSYDCQSLISNGQIVESGVIESSKWVADTKERCGQSTSALHFTAENLSMCFGSNGRRGWGGSYEVDFGPANMKAPIDASAWDGFSFWVRRGAGNKQGSIIVLAVDRFASGNVEATDPVTGEVVSCSSGDPAVQALAEPDFSKCDPFAIGVTLRDDWTFVPVYFSEMKQKGFGTPSPLGLNTAELLRLQFLVTPGDWDLWIDDIDFFVAP
jgi:hypothetical protein